MIEAQVTDTEAQTLAFIDDHWRDYWTSPTVQQIAEFNGWSSKSTAHDHLQRMLDKGLLKVKKLSIHRVLYRTTWGENVV